MIGLPNLRCADHRGQKFSRTANVPLKNVMDVRRTAVTLAVAGASVFVTVSTAGTSQLYAWWVIAPSLSVAAVVVGVRRHRPDQLRPWRVLLGALTLLWIGWTMSASMGAGIGGEATQRVLPHVRNALYVIAYPTLGLASLLMVRCRTGGRDRDNVIDALIVMVTLATVLGSWLLGTGDVTDIVSDLDRLWVSASPLLLATVASASIRVLFAAGTRLPAAWLLFVSSALTLFGNLWTSQLIRDGSPTQVTGIDVLWVLAFVAVGAAALHPSMRDLTAPLPAGVLIDGMPVDRLALLGGALVALALSHLRVAGGSPEAIVAAVAGVLVALLVMWRVARLLRERDVARQAVSKAAVRDSIIATIGRWALDERSTAKLLADVGELLSEALTGVDCTVSPTASCDPSIDELGRTVTRFTVDDGSAPLAEIVVSSDVRRADAPGEKEFLEAVAALLSAAVRRRTAEDRLRYEALHDPLTGLPNRRLAVERLAQLLSRRDVSDVTVAFLDLDGFKAINDSFGHNSGDRVLRDIAHRLHGAVRESDTVARLAGDEFVVLVPSLAADSLEQLVSRLRAATTLEASSNGCTLAVTASIGIAIAKGGSISPEALLQRADAAMYRAKMHGGGTSWADEALPPPSTALQMACATG